MYICIYVYMYICIRVMKFGTSFSFWHTVSNAVMPIGTACPKFHAFSVSLPLNAYFHGPHVDWAVPSLVTMFHLQNAFIEAIPN